MDEERFHIISDGSCDLPEDYVREHNVTVVPFYVSFGDDKYLKEGIEMPVRQFYRMMVDDPGTLPKSSMPSTQDFVDAMLPFAKEGRPVICICITSKFSGSVQSAELAKEEVLEEVPGAQITVIDSRINTVLQGLYVIEAVRLRDRGTGYEESVRLLEDIRDSGRIFFTVGSIDYLKGNGRIGKVAKVVGGILNIRPVITLKEGEIFASGVGRSRKSTVAKSISIMKEYLAEMKATPETWAIDIGYGYDYAEALGFRDSIIEALSGIGFGIAAEEIPIFQIGAGIGVHTGPYPLGVSVIRRAFALS